ncbi:hybrid sensor histidine kinase/response regulator [Desulfobacter latus]|uniref:histidine kinase n=1 Tax=Desulfobacter latus TaxID=2292 RepID=A0A850T8H4_9BACT|nr:response regulator [Desulfobacter latus]NWH05475.1 response regulator [Desulfobacter latus]
MLQKQCRSATKASIDGPDEKNIITKGKQAQLNLNESEGKYRILLEELRYRNIINTAIAKASSLFISPVKVDYQAILRTMGESIDVNRVYIFEITGDGQTLSNTHEWCAKGTAPQIEKLKALDAHLFSWWTDQLRDGKNIVIEDVANLSSRAAAEKQILQSQQIQSLVCVPIWAKGKKLWGFMGFDDTQKTRKWTETEIEALQILGEMISGDLERNASEQRLAFERNQLLSIFDSLDGNIFVSDPHTYEILYVNKAFKKYFAHEVIGKICYREFHGFDSPCSFCSNKQILKEKPKIHRHEFYNPMMDKTFSIMDRIISWPDGRDVRFELAIDITEKKQIESRLRQAQKMEAIGTLAGGIAHDFNNILSGIFGYLQLAKFHILEPELAEKDLEKISEGAKRATLLTKQILTFSRHKWNDRRPVVVFPLIEETLKLLRSVIPSNIEIKNNIVSKSMILADSTQIHQLAMNLCTNAYQAMENRGGVLTIGLNELVLGKDQLSHEKNLLPGKYLKLEVSDTGPGIENAIQNKIFDPYFTTKKTGKGTGLGLAMVAGIVKKHNGFITVHSQPGEGACFKVFLPVIDPNVSMEKPTTKEDATACSGTETVMLVDDETDILISQEKFLTGLGYKVSSFEDGQSALQAFLSHPQAFDLIVTDMTMPRMSGETLSREILKIKPDIPIILCTGFHETVTRELALGLGIRKYVQKPIEVSILSKMIRELLDA